MSQMCIHFARGFCAKGAGCRFNHNFQIGAISPEMAAKGGGFPGKGIGPSGGMGDMEGMAGGYGPMATMQMSNMSSPYGQGGMPIATASPDLSGVQPATPVEVEEFLILNPVEQRAADQFRNLDPRGQRIVLNRGSLEGARDATAAFIGRLVQVQKLLSGATQLSPGDWICPACGDTQFARNLQCRKCAAPKPSGASTMMAMAAMPGAAQMPGQMMMSSGNPLEHTTPAEPSEVEQFLIMNPVEAHAQQKMRSLDPRVQRLVIGRGGMEGARDHTAALIGRMVKMEKIARGQVQVPPGDWICPGCGDHQFSRNVSCRRCQTVKPPSAAQQLASFGQAGMMGMGGMDMQALIAGMAGAGIPGMM